MYKYQSKCKFRMLTTIGDKIVEIRPKQIIESNQKLDNDYLILVKSKEKSSPKPGRPKVDKSNEHSKQLPADSQTNT